MLSRLGALALVALVTGCSSDRQYDGGLFIDVGLVDGDAPDLPEAGPDATGSEDADLGDGAVCDEMDLDVARVTPNVLIVLDRSNSMMAFENWDAVREAVYGVTEALESRLAFGLMVFPDADGADACDGPINACEPADDTLVACAPRTARRIRTTLEEMSTCGGTPTAETLRSASVYFSLEVTPSHLPPVDAVPSYVLLATDGAPNCNGDADDDSCRCTAGGDACVDNPWNCLDDERTYDAIAELRGRGVALYVLGISASAFGDVLDEMARLGGTERALLAEDHGGIREAFESVTGRVTSCAFVLRGIDPAADPHRVNVYVDGEAVPMDDDGECDAGWGWVDRDRTRLELCGPYCEALVRDEVEAVRVTFGCPTLI